LDRTFGSNGFAVFDLGGDDEVNDVAVQTSDKDLVGFVLAGSTTRNHPGTGTNRDFVLARVTPGGMLDNTFGTNGVTTVDFSGNFPADVPGAPVVPGSSYEDTAYSVAIVNDGGASKIVVAGKASN